MKNLLFVLFISLMVSMFGCEYSETIEIEYEFTGNGDAPVYITYLDVNSIEQTITIAENHIENGWRWSHKFTVDSSDKNEIFASATMETDEIQEGSITILENNKIIISTNKYIPVKDEGNNIIGYMLHVKMYTKLD